MTEVTDERGTKRHAKRPLLVRIVGIAVLLAVVSFLWWRFGPVSERNARRAKILATGTIEATEVEVSAEFGGTIEKLLVDEGYRLERGQPVAKIEDSQLEAEALRAEAALGRGWSLPGPRLRLPKPTGSARTNFSRTAFCRRTSATTPARASTWQRVIMTLPLRN